MDRNAPIEKERGRGKGGGGEGTNTRVQTATTAHDEREGKGGQRDIPEQCHPLSAPCVQLEKTVKWNTVCSSKATAVQPPYCQTENRRMSTADEKHAGRRRATSKG